jgi:hypothetical protein
MTAKCSFKMNDLAQVYELIVQLLASIYCIDLCIPEVYGNSEINNFRLRRQFALIIHPYKLTFLLFRT